MKTFTPKGNTVGMIMPQFIMQTKLSSGAKLVYALLCDYAGNKDHCWPSQLKLAQKLYCSISSIKRYLAELAKAKFVHIQHNSQKSSVYFILDNPICHEVKLSYQNQSHESKLSYQNSSHGVKLNCQQSKLNCHKLKLNYESNLNNLTLRTIPPKSPIQDLGFAQNKQSGRVYSFEIINTDFESFWQHYPKKESKDLAKHLWHSMAKAKELPELKVMHLALQCFCKTDGWQRENKRYVPQLVNWLKNKRWQDIDQSELNNLVNELEQIKAIAKPFLSNKNCVEVSKYKILFEQFAINFTIPSQGIKSMAFGLWSFLHRKNIAPTVLEKQEDNIVTYLKNYKISMLCCA